MPKFNLRAFALGSLIMLIFLSMWMSNRDKINTRKIKDVPYSEFMASVKKGDVVTVVVPENNRGTIVGTQKDGEKISTTALNDLWLVNELLANKVEVKGAPAEKPNMILWILGTFGPTLLIVGVLVWMLRKQYGGSGIFSLGNNPAKEAKPEDSTVRFADVAGCDEAKQEVSELVDFLKEPQRFQALGGKIPKGVLLVGDPGTGKTLLAKAIAGEAGVPFFSASGSDFVEMFVGLGSKRVRTMFEEARKKAPCIVYIDEIDAVGRQRSSSNFGGGHDEREQTLNQILVEMDGFKSGADTIIVLASTNRVDILDKALLRPGRFDRQVVVPKPDVKGREQILQVHSKNVPMAPDVRLDVLARSTPGYSGADLANMVNEATLFAARFREHLVTMRHFELANDKIIMGPERKSMNMSEKERITTAYHEAGHAAVGLVMGNDPVHKVSIVPRGRALGVTMHLPQEDRYCLSKEHWLNEIAMLMGGRAAEEVFTNQITTGASNDMMRATNIAKAMVTEWGMSDVLGPLTYADNEHTGASAFGPEVQKQVDSEIRTFVTQGHSKALEIMHAYKESIEKMVKILLEKETIHSEEAEMCFPEDIQKRSRARWNVKDMDTASMGMPLPSPVTEQVRLGE